MSEKNVKILFNTICKYRRAAGSSFSDRHTPLYEIPDILKYISKLGKKLKFRDLPSNKFCFLESYSISQINDKDVFLGCFISAKSDFRPNTINKKTGVERENPKQLSEGDMQRSHFAIIVDRVDNEVYFLLEYNFDGLSMKNIIDYLKYFNRQYLESKELPKNYTLKYLVIGKEDFLETLKSMKSAKIAEVYFDKQLLGSEALNFSNRTSTLKNDLKLTIGSSVGESLKETGFDLFNKLNSGKSPISKIRIKGKDEDNNDILIDTSYMNKFEFINVDKNSETGELNSTQIFSGFKKIINEL